MTVQLHGIGTAVPAQPLPQDLVLEGARRILGPRYPFFDRLAESFGNSGVKTRYTVAEPEWFFTDTTWADRNGRYLRGASALFEDAAGKALERAGWSADEIDIIVTVSSTGVATPTLEALVWKSMGFRRDVRRVPVFGLGCAGGVTGLGIAQSLAHATPGAKVLLVAVEICTLSFRTDRAQKADIIAAVLFGDGAAACCLGSDSDGAGLAELGAASELIWPDTLSIMGWDVDDTGLGVVFDRAIPTFARHNLADAMQQAMETSGLTAEAIDRFVFHPGGMKVVEAIEAALKLERGSLVAEREVLRDYGNMSAPTALFVLDNLLRDGQHGQWLLSALGPGFTASFIPVKALPQ